MVAVLIILVTLMMKKRLFAGILLRWVPRATQAVADGIDTRILAPFSVFYLPWSHTSTLQAISLSNAAQAWNWVKLGEYILIGRMK